MRPFCLLRSKEEICYTNGTEKKPFCPEPRCKGKQLPWLHEVFSPRDVSVDSTEPEEEGLENVTIWGGEKKAGKSLMNPGSQ